MNSNLWHYLKFGIGTLSLMGGFFCIFYLDSSALSLMLTVFLFGISSTMAIDDERNMKIEDIPEKLETRYGTKTDKRAMAQKNWYPFTLEATDTVSVTVPAADNKTVTLMRGDTVTLTPRIESPFETETVPIRRSPKPKKVAYRDTDLRLIAKIEDPIEKQVKKDMKKLGL